MGQILLATKNRGKQRELTEMLAPFHLQVLTLADVEKDLPEVEEDGQTFVDNALKKARTYYEWSNIPTLADDSGLSVEALAGEPGVFSARYAGEGRGDQANNDKLLHKLKGIPWERRDAQFICVIAFVDQWSVPLVVGGRCQGKIAYEPLGNQGFGYDPLFYVPEEEQTMAELMPATKNRLSHRHHALRAFLDVYTQTRVVNRS